MKISWCLKQKNGIEIINPKDHLAKAYMKEAEDTLENMYLTKGKWKVITAYYACYNALYSLLMKIGIKCEIHDCSIELMEYLDFNKEDIEFLKSLKEDRIKNQYYLKNIKLKNESRIKEFVLKCKKIDLNDQIIEKIMMELK